MAHFATKRFNYWGQLGILTAFMGAGLLIGGIASLIPILDKLNFKDFSGPSSKDFMDKLMVPENATPLRWMQFISTLFLFFLPPFFYALVCHKKPWLHLGFNHTVTLPQTVVVILLMVACLPIVGSLQEVTEMLPWSKAALLKFKLAEEEYNKQIAIIARMDNFTDYIVSLIMVAFLPAVFEEVFFRGGLQNFLSRWIKLPIIAIIITSILFSAVHGSYLGFLSRAALGFVLGWVYYRTGNIWLSAIGHFVNNAFGVTVLYIASKPHQKLDLSKMNDPMPLWLGLAGAAAVYGLFILFDKVSKYQLDRPGQEVPVPGYIDSNNPFIADIENIGHTEQSKY